MNRKTLTVETRELSPATKRAIRESQSGRGVTLIGKTPEEVRARYESFAQRLDLKLEWKQIG